MDLTEHAWDRRSLLRAGALTTLAAAVGSAPLVAARPASAVEPRPRGDGMFDLNQPSKVLLREKKLHAKSWIIQSLAFDNVHQHCYFAQVNPYPGAKDRPGDLWLNRWDMKAGKVTGAMALHGFGHGSQIGVEVYDGRVYLWVESKAGNGHFGTEMARFRFVNGATINAKSAGVTHLKPRIRDLHEIVNPQPTVDPVSDRLVVRFRCDSQPYLAVYTMANARAGRMDKYETFIKTPYRETEDGKGETWAKENPAQGFTAMGRYAYLFEGGPGHEKTPRPSYITVMDIETGRRVRDLVPTEAGKTLPYREPEGLAIRIVDGRPQLAMGFKSRDTPEKRSIARAFTTRTNSSDGLSWRAKARGRKFLSVSV